MPRRPGIGPDSERAGRNAAFRRRSDEFFARETGRSLGERHHFYNDRAGIEAMAAAAQPRRVWPAIGPTSSLVLVALRDSSGRLLPGLVAGDRWSVVGEEGRRYSIVVRNQSDYRLETVLSVDGLDGRAASVRKRGYVIDPHRSLVVDGFRQSAEAVAAFRFRPVRDRIPRRSIATPATSRS